MIAPKGFNGLKWLEDTYNMYPLVEMYFSTEQSPLMDSIDALYEKLNLENEVISLTALDMLGKA